MKIQIQNKPSLNVPKQARQSDAGYDVIATSKPNIVGESFTTPNDLVCWKSISYIEYLTNVFIAPQDERTIPPFDIKEGLTSFHTLLFPRSSISKYNLSLANSIGLIDNGYRGELLFRFKYHFQPEDFIMVSEHGGNRIYGVVKQEKIYQMGDKIGQIVASPTIPIQFEVVEVLPPSERGTGGLGHSGK